MLLWCLGQLCALANLALCRFQAKDTHWHCFGTNDGIYMFSASEGVTKSEEAAYRRSSVEHTAAQQQKRHRAKVSPIMMPVDDKAEVIS